MTLDHAKCIFPLLKGKVRSEPFGGMIFSLQPNRILVINSTGYEIASEIDGKTSLEKASFFLAEKYHQPKDLVMRDLQAFLKFLNGQDLLDDQLGVSERPKLVEEELNKHQKMAQPLVGMYDYELSAPISALIEITRKCNLRCLHCFSNSGKIVDCQRELTTKQWKAFIDNLAEMKVFMVFFGGGEPLCQKDFMDIAAYTKNQGIEMCLLSNLTLIDAGIAQQLRDVGFYKIEGNLDGHTAEVYEALRQTKGSFQRTIPGIRHCVDVGLHVRVNCTLTRLNYKYIREIVELACDLGVMDIAFLRLIPAGRGDENFVKLDIGDDCYSKELVPKLSKLRAEFAGKIGIGFEQETELNRLSDPNNAMPWCGSGRIHCTITPEGNVKPDPSFPDNDSKAIAGNILRDNFKKIWSRSEIFRKIRHTRFSGCQNCRHVQCAGGDVYRIYHHYGEIMAHRDPRCVQIGAK